MAPELQLELVGLMKCHNFQVAKSLGEVLKLEFPSIFTDPIVRPLHEFDWDVYVTNKRKELGGEMWQYSSNVMCFMNGCLLGDENELCSYAEKQWQFTFLRPWAMYAVLAEEYYSSHMHSTGHIYVYMDIEIGEVAVGRMLFELFSDLCPKTCQNFKALCTSETGTSQSDLLLSYKDSLFHRLLPNGWVQGGDIIPYGGESIYSPAFEDESFAVSHNKRGILGMANKGPHSNGTQFYITLQPTLWMDRRYVAFGQVIEGAEVLRRLEEVPTFNERPKQDCKIVSCGLMDI